LLYGAAVIGAFSTVLAYVKGSPQSLTSPTKVSLGGRAHRRCNQYFNGRSRRVHALGVVELALRAASCRSIS